MGTIRDAYVDVLTEMQREDTQKLYLGDFLYYYNKAISDYMKKRYELFEVTQQLTDDLRVWKTPFRAVGKSISIANDIKNYRHVLACIVEVTLRVPDGRCTQKAGEAVKYKARRMTSNIKAGILDNDYLKATFYRPYFEIIGDTINIDTGTDPKKKIRNITTYVEYLRQPVAVDMTEAEVRAEADTSQVLEFSTDVGEEIVKMCIMALLERDSNQRMQSHAAVNQTVNDLSLKGG